MSILSSTKSGKFKPLNSDTIVKDLGLSGFQQRGCKNGVQYEIYSFDMEKYKWGQYIKRSWEPGGPEIYEANFILNGLHFMIKLNTYWDALMIVDYWKPETVDSVNLKADKLRTIVKTLL
jgi:hypothetical protein